MKTASSVRRPAVTVLAALLVLATACGADSVSRADVAARIGEQLQKQNIDAQDVTCSGDLRAAVGQTVRCSFTTGGQPVDAIATVTSVEGSSVRYDITTQARSIAKELLAWKVSERLTQQANLPVDAVTCDEDLAPMPNASARCTVVSRGKPVAVVVTVTKVNGGLISFTIKRA